MKRYKYMANVLPSLLSFVFSFKRERFVAMLEKLQQPGRLGFCHTVPRHPMLRGHMAEPRGKMAC